MNTRAGDDDVSTQMVEFFGDEHNRLNGTFYQGQQTAETLQSKIPPILFMHGGGQTRHSWHGTAKQLAAMGYDALTVDARGHGDSEWVASKNYTFQHYRDDLRVLTAQIQERWGSSGKPAVLVGASMGGISAILAQSQGGHEPDTELFSAIVLVDITPRMARSGVDKIMGFLTQDIRKGFASVQEAADTVASYLPNRKRPKSLDGLRKNLRQHKDGRWHWHWDPAFVDGEHSIINGKKNRQATLFDAAAQISVPTLLVRGAKSELVTIEAAEEFLELVPHAKMIDVSDAGHMVAGDKNDIFASAVVDFLNNEFLENSSA